MNTAVTIGTASTRVLDPNPRRRLAILTNNSNEDVYFSLGSAAVITAGIPVKAGGGSLILEQARVGDWIFRGEITGICASGGKVVSSSEVDR